MKKFKRLMTTFILMIFSITALGCGNSLKEDTTQKNYEGRTFYEIFVRSFNDSNGDGIGDIKGVTKKLDYLENLGIKGIWLMPIFKANSYHGYDVIDYYSIQDEYGTMDDLKDLLEEAHKRDIKVIIDLVLNHTSTENEWFKEARADENSPYRNYYIWTKDMSKATSISAMNTKEWSQNGDKNELYYSIFDSKMPDLNFDNEEVVEEVKKIAKYYLEEGVDGFRLDAARWIFNEKSKNISFWSDFNNYVKSVNKDATLVAEVWDAPSNIAEYTNCFDSFFEFSMGKYAQNRIKSMSISGFVDDYSLVDNIYKEENQDFVMAPFLSNHDNVRIMTSLRDDFKMKEAACMYLMLPGSPFIYYGEETGTLGSKPDEKLREPFIWSSSDISKNTSWEGVTSDINKVAVENQETNKDSLLNFYKDILKVKNSYKSLRYGTAKTLEGDYDSNVMVMERNYEKETSYVIINGNVDKQSIPIPKGKYKVLYSSENRSESTIKSKNGIEIDGNEIIIITKE